MAYVEWLRVRNTIKVLLIVLGALFLLMVVARLATLRLQYDSTAWLASLQSSKDSHVTKTVLPDGTQRIVIDNPKDRVHIVVRNRGYRGQTITVIDRSRSQRYSHHSVNSFGMGSIRVQQRDLPGGHGTITRIRTNGAVEFANFLIFGGILALIVATVLGSPFAKENDGHLEIAFTKPISRVALGMQTLAIDLVGILLSILAGVVFLVLAQAMFMVPRFAFGSVTWSSLALVILAPCAWYAMLACATASLQRGYGAVVGFAWPVALAVAGLALIHPNGYLLAAVRDGAAALSYLDPVKYMDPTISTVRVGGTSLIRVDTLAQSLALLILTIVYGAAALWQWRRVEA